MDTRYLVALTSGLLLSGFSASILAQDAQTPETPAEVQTSTMAPTPAEPTVPEEVEEAEETRTSANGSYEWKRSWGAGIQVGYWFQDLDRWNASIADDNKQTPYDVSGIWHFDLAVEASLLENTRISLFGGFESGFSDPSASAFYGGIEPAFAFRRDMWEVALGIGVGFGSLTSEFPSGASWDASLVLLRPFIEVRRYLSDWSAVYGRFGFNQWLISDPSFDNILFTRQGDATGDKIEDSNLNVGGPFVALGVRFGSYPEHVKYIDDKDNDGYRDDVDECPEEPEDFDKFEDEDGCPETDNDNDGILDGVDKCPLVAEDKDGWQDEDGCPEDDDDSDGDGILNPVDKCPNDAEDKDGFQDEDGCPDTDNDNDGILDVDDKCPDKAGVPEKQGCPYERVQVTLDKIVILEKVFFAFDKATIKPESFGLLDEVAKTIIAYPRIKKIEIQGHTDHAGSEKYNKDLSGRRAKSVLDYLVGKGVEEARLTSKGVGFDQPLVPLPENKKETPEGAERNRRVEFAILEQEKVTKVVQENEVPVNAAEVKPAADVKPEAEVKPDAE